jgi:hypothetical protein
MDDKKVDLSALLGIALAVGVGLTAFWLLKIVLGLVWEYFWWLVGGALLAGGVWFLQEARKRSSGA